MEVLCTNKTYATNSTAYEAAADATVEEEDNSSEE